ncbi:hydrophobe/amphiphile efflux-1 (HAE1) family protein [Filomicrobium insigne]|uniref:Hydrophobe/amphiphile efflux-1 (HAE1) family protein n=1 Tax=Filomicrobium insigne TaxID=418854 RepID=A0A1H0N0A2_9HYPH|nr:efflux RND transporter permease subunit [Filomicrobium insigne]SDO86114.1 hydrophobe/amphiphile efflux-1 (HAE1) family protein [Filomicrobium insigne]
MNTNVSAWSIRRPVPALVLFMVLVVIGTLSFGTLPITRFPNIDIPIVQVLITQAGSAPSELETQVTKKVEDAIAGVNGVKHQTSTITEGSSTSMIEFRLEIDPDRALNDVKDAIARIRADLPRTIDEPIVQRIEIEGLPIVTYSARAPAMTPEELSWFVDDTVSRALRSVANVSAVDRIGGVTREIHVELDPDRLLSLGITAGDVNQQIRATNINLAGGRGEIAGREQAIRTLAGQKSVADLAATSIALPGNRYVRLDELGKVVDTVEEPRTFADLDGEPVVAFAVSRAKGASDTNVADAVAERIKQLQTEYPNVIFTRIDNTVDYTYGVFESTMKTLMEGAVLAILVVFVFLRDWRATIIAAIALPLSIIPTFWAMETMGFSLNLVSLLAITIVTGILVDDAIVEIENIVRHMRMGKSAYRAALEAADEIGLAVIAITVTIIAVFMPVSFMGGIAGQYFRQFGMTVAFAVAFSLLVARLITPLLAAYFMRSNKEAVEKESWLLRIYTRLVGWSVHHRIKTVLLGIAIFFCSIGSFYLLPSGFLPVEDVSRSLLAIELPPGSRIEDTREVTERIANHLRRRPDVESVFVNGGNLMGSGAEVRKATLIITLKPKDKREKPQAEIQEEIGRELADIPDVRYWFLQDNGQRQFQLVVSGRDGEAVDRVGAALTSQANRLPQLLNVVSTAELDRPELRVFPKSDVAADLGVTTQAISEAVRIATIGDIGANLAKFDVGDRQIPIRVKLPDSARANRHMLESIKVPTASGGSVPLSTVARFELSQGATSIDRYDRTRRVLIGGDLVGRTPLGDAVNAVMKLPTAQNLPEGVVIKQFGDAEVMAEVFESFGQAMAAGLMMVYAVLVLLFASFLQPVTILFSLPLSIGGAIVALAITANSISLPVVIGVLMLMGIVTKNAIMLVDFAVEEIASGVPRNEAIVDAGRKRARPIIMTTIAMIGGMLPSALALDSGGEFRAPMAIAVIGGLVSSTVLSLVFVPAVFVLMDDVGRVLGRVFGRFVGAVDEPDEPTAHSAKPLPSGSPAASAE